ncbi:MAG: hypothetical protein ABIH69_07695 [bacterium]
MVSIKAINKLTPLKPPLLLLTKPMACNLVSFYPSFKTVAVNRYEITLKIDIENVPKEGAMVQLQTKFLTEVNRSGKRKPCNEKIIATTNFIVSGNGRHEVAFEIPCSLNKPSIDGTYSIEVLPKFIASIEAEILPPN